MGVRSPDIHFTPEFVIIGQLAPGIPRGRGRRSRSDGVMITAIVGEDVRQAFVEDLQVLEEILEHPARMFKPGRDGWEFHVKTAGFRVVFAKTYSKALRDYSDATRSSCAAGGRV